MSMNTHAPKQTNWLLWGGGAAAAIVVLAAAGFWFDWFGNGAADVAAPATEQAAPASE